MKRIVVCIILLLTSQIFAEVVIVPDDYDSIRDAVDYLSNNEGGTVAIRPGTNTGSNNKNITWLPWLLQDGSQIVFIGRHLKNQEKNVITN